MAVTRKIAGSESFYCLTESCERLRRGIGRRVELEAHVFCRWLGGLPEIPVAYGKGGLDKFDIVIYERCGGAFDRADLADAQEGTEINPVGTLIEVALEGFSGKHKFIDAFSRQGFYRFAALKVKL